MANLCYGCKSLSSLPDISKWDISNVFNMTGMFYNCQSLSLLPNLSNWPISKVYDVKFMFHKCCSFSYLTDNFLNKYINYPLLFERVEVFQHCVNLLNAKETDQ